MASAALLAYGVRPVRAAPPLNCTTDGTATIVTCTGDQSGGVLLNNGGGTYTILNVNNLTTNIAPASGVVGVEFDSNGAVTLNVNPGPFAIITTDAIGIFAVSNTNTVTVNSTADISTSGSGATALQASGQNALVSITSSGNIATSGNNAFGIVAGTVYGDVIINSSSNIATTGTFSAGINVGTIGHLGTNDGAITIRSTGNITTSGSSAIGINAATVYGPVDITSSGNIAVSGAASIGINAQTQGDVRITSTGNIASGPDSSVGILALSQSGSVLITSTGDVATAGQTGIGIYARAGQIATVYASGNITTLGDNAPGIAASGYTGTIVVSSATIRTSGTDSHGITAYGAGDVVVTSTSKITTTGPTSDGINVVSTNGMAAVVNSGDISATGTGSAGIYAAGRAGSVVMNLGNVVGGPCCAGVMQRSANATTLLNWGTITAGLADFAIESDSASNTVENFGTVTGDVSLTGGPSAFNNHAGALFNSGASVQAGLVTNDGVIAPGGRGTIETTALGDDFVQTGTGVFAVDVDAVAATSDQIVVSDTAALAGKVAVSLLSIPPTAAQTFLILSSLGTTDNGLGLIASPALHATLSFPNGQDVILGINVDFYVDDLNPNQRAIGENLDAAFHAGVGGLGPVILGLLNTVSDDAYKAALNQLLPELYSDAEISALYASLGFSNSLLSCKVNGTDTAAIIREGQCLWAGANARFLDSGTTFDQIGFNETAGLFTAGAQVALDNVWRLGFAGGFQTSTLDTATNAQSQGSLGQGGVALKYNPGPLLIAGTLSGGGGQYDTKRPMSFGGFTGLAEGDQSLGFFNGGMRVAYVFGEPHLYWKPTLDMNLTYLHLGAVAESGGNGAGLAIASQGQTVFTLAPTLEAGTEWWLAGGTLVRPMLRAGAIWYTNNDLALNASFESAPAGVGPFTINTKLDDVMGLVSAGVDVITSNDSVLRLSYDAQLGETTQIQSVGIKGSAKF